MKKTERETYLRVIKLLMDSFEQAIIPNDMTNSSEFEWTRENIHGLEDKLSSKFEGLSKRLGALCNRLTNLEKERGVETQSSQNKIDILDARVDKHKKDVETLAHLDAKKDISLKTIRTRLTDLEKKSESLPEKKVSKKGQNQAGKKRGPYKKKAAVKTETKRKAPIFHEVENDLGTRTIAKYLDKINNVLNHSKNFTKAEIIKELRSKVNGSQLAKLGGKSTLKEVKKAKWRLDARRRREAKIGIYGQKDYWKRNHKKK